MNSKRITAEEARAMMQDSSNSDAEHIIDDIYDCIVKRCANNHCYLEYFLPKGTTDSQLKAIGSSLSSNGYSANLSSIQDRTILIVKW